MAETVTVVTGQTGSEAPAKTEASNRPDWLPEKFNSPEAMAQAYSELEKKLGGAGADKVETNPATQKQPQAQSEQEKDGNDDGAAEALSIAGLDMSTFSNEFEKEGKLSDESYAKLAEKGFPKSVVDTYIAGRQASINQNAAMAEQHLAQVKAVAGGDKEYVALVTWASKNLSVEEQDAYDAMVSTANVAQAKAAVEWLKSKFDNKEGVEPKLVHGTSSSELSDTFKSTAEVVRAMKDPKYKTDPAYRNEVALKLSKSKVF